jgi:hypothetical protein
MFPLTPMYIDYFVLSIILPPLQARVQEVATRQSKVAASAHGLTRVRSSGRLRFVRLPESNFLPHARPHDDSEGSNFDSCTCASIRPQAETKLMQFIADYLAPCSFEATLGAS